MIKREELSNPQSCMSRAREDEMTFVLLGRDPAATVAIRAWIEERIRLGKNERNDAQITEARGCIDAMLAYRLRSAQCFGAVSFGVHCVLEKGHRGPCQGDC